MDFKKHFYLIIDSLIPSVETPFIFLMHLSCKQKEKICLSIRFAGLYMEIFAYNIIDFVVINVNNHAMKRRMS